MKVKLVVLTGNEKDREIPLPSSQFIIGRKKECHLRARSERVSKLHCAIVRKAGRVVVRDLKSMNGTLVNGESITGTRFLADGDVLGVGPLQFRVSIVDESGNSVQMLDKRDVNWLMSQSDQFEISADYDTQLLLAIPDDLLDDDGAEDDAPGGVSTQLSAGEYLRKKVDDAGSE